MMSKATLGALETIYNLKGDSEFTSDELPADIRKYIGSMSKGSTLKSRISKETKQKTYTITPDGMYYLRKYAGV